MTTVWLLQSALSGLLALAYLSLPDRWHRIFHRVDLPRMLALDRPRPPRGVSFETMLAAVTVLRADAEAVAATMRITAAPTLLVAFMSVYAAMRQDDDTRRYVARIFGVALSAWAVTLLAKAPLGLVIQLGPWSFRGPAGPGALHTAHESTLFYVVAAFALANFVHGFVPARHRRERPLSGMANTRPPSLWILWFAQAALLLGCGVGLFLLRRHAALAVDITRADHSLPAVEQAFRELRLGAPGIRHAHFLADVLETLPPMCVAIAAFTVYAMRPSREWVWRFLAGTFAAHFALLLALLAFATQSGAFKPWVLPAVAVPAGLLLLGNLWFALLEREYFTRESADGPDGWIATDLAAGPAMLAATALRGGRRARHGAGVGVRGRLEVEPLKPSEPRSSLAPMGAPEVVRALPAHEFFHAAGHTFRVVARFSNANSDDDAAADARGAALEVVDPDGSTLVLLLSTGAFSEAPHVFRYVLWAAVDRLGRWAPAGLRERNLTRREAAVAAMRRGPPSYLDLAYHSQVVRFWVGRNDVRYLARFQLAPWDLAAPEPGCLADGDAAFARGRAPGDRRASDYLRTELKRRLETEDQGVATRDARARMRLRVQLHKIASGDDVQWYDPSVDWRADDHPWLDVGTVVFHTAMPDDEAEARRFDPSACPHSLGVPAGTWPRDFRSLGDSQRRVVSRVQALRRWMLEAFGIPGPPDAPRDP